MKCPYFMFTSYCNLSWLARKLLIYSLQMFIRYDPKKTANSITSCVYRKKLLDTWLWIGIPAMDLSYHYFATTKILNPSQSRPQHGYTMIYPKITHLIGKTIIHWVLRYTYILRLNQPQLDGQIRQIRPACVSASTWFGSFASSGGSGVFTFSTQELTSATGWLKAGEQKNINSGWPTLPRQIVRRILVYYNRRHN